VRLWKLVVDDGPFAEWSRLAGHCPYDLLEGILIERSLPDSLSGAVVLAGNVR